MVVAYEQYKASLAVDNMVTQVIKKIDKDLEEGKSESLIVGEVPDDIRTSVSKAYKEVGWSSVRFSEVDLGIVTVTVVEVIPK